MAELLGVAASGIAVVQIATEFGDRVLALKRLWDEIKDVPDTITDLVSQIEVLTPILDQIYADTSQFALLPGSTAWNDKTTQICVSHCRRVKEELARLVEDLSSHINSTKRSRRSIAKFKVVMKKETLAKYEKRLSRALQLLNLANTCYISALVKLQPALIMEQIMDMDHLPSNSEARVEVDDLCKSEEDCPCKKTPAETENPRCQFETGSYRRIGVRRWQSPLSKYAEYLGRMWTCSYSTGSEMEPSGYTYQAEMQLPSWLATQIWNLQLFKAKTGWKVSLRISPIIPDPDDSAAFQCIDKRDLAGLLQLFQQSKASPHERCESGWTLLHAAAYTNEWNIFYTLIKLGASVRDSGFYHWLPAFDAFFPLSSPGNHLDRHQSLICDYIEDPDEYTSRFIIPSAVYVYPKCLRLFIRIHYPRHYDKPIWKRCYLLAYCSEMGPRDSRYTRPECFRLLCWEDSVVRPVDVLQSIEHGCSIIALAAAPYAWSYILVGESEWAVLLRELFQAAITGAQSLANLSATSAGSYRIMEGMSPLMVLIRSIYQRHVWYPPALYDLHDRVFRGNRCIRAWVESIASCGVALEEYGRTEILLFWNYRETVTTPDFLDDWTNVGFRYGPRIRDWSLHWIGRDDITSEFWRLVEHEVEHEDVRVPGGWDDRWDT